MKKRIPQKPSRKPLAIAVLVLLALNIGAAALARAIEAPLVSVKRVSLAAQVGADWRRPTNQDLGTQTKPAVKLVGSYSLYGPPNGKAGGSVAIVTPFKIDLNRDHQFEGGVYLSVIWWSGLDQ